MCTAGIAWCTFSWEAFATLITGVLAVGGAVLVGLRQTKIFAWQAEIQEQAFKADLFERRFQNYEVVRDFLGSLLSVPAEIDTLRLQKFFLAQREAEFLFSPAVSSRLANIWTLCGELNAKSLEEVSEIAQNGHAGVTLPQEKAECYRRVSSEYHLLPDVYREMRLSNLDHA